MVTIYKPFFQSKAKQCEVAIDLGHGSDTFERTGGKGVIVNGVRYEEHDFNSRVGVELDRLLKAIGFKTIMYQKPYSPEIDLNKRISYYNSIMPDLVWSIHANANSNDEVDGCCAFYWNTNSAMRKLAQEYGKQVKAAGYHTHGDGTHASEIGSWTNLAITRATKSNAVLTENGFMTNDEPGVNDDFELLFGSKKEEYARDIARIHAISICKHFEVTYTEEEGTIQVSKPVEAKPATKPAATKPVAKDYFLKGDKGSGVGTIQKNLNAAGASPKLAVDNIFGSATENAVEAFQKAHGLVVDGIYGSATTAKMKQVLSKPKKEYVQLPKSAATWRTYKLNVPPQKEYSDWSLTPSRYGGLEYEILGRPYANVVTIKTSRGKRNIYVAPSTGAKIIKK